MLPISISCDVAAAIRSHLPRQRSLTFHHRRLNLNLIPVHFTYPQHPRMLQHKFAAWNQVAKIMSRPF